MAFTSIHPIKSTLNKAIDYIIDKDKTNNGIYISVNSCDLKNASNQFSMLRKENNTRGTVLARHLIQSFLPGETNPEQAHKIGLELCKHLLKDEYQFIITTHIDKEHIHNHIIFNNVNMATGKCYRSNKKSYHGIRHINDKLCKENGLSIIDEYYDKFNRDFKKSKSYFQYLRDVKGISLKSRLEKDIDFNIKTSHSFEEFIKKMEVKYEIKYGKYIAFKDKSRGEKSRFKRSKSLGDDYTEEAIKNRINDKSLNNDEINIGIKREEKVIDISSNSKITSNKGLEIWARKNNLKVMANTIIQMRNNGIKTREDLEKFIKNNLSNLAKVQSDIKELEKEFNNISMLIENVNTVKTKKSIYDYYSQNKDDKEFFKEYKTDIEEYKNAVSILKKDYKSFTEIPQIKDLYYRLKSIESDKNKLYEKYYDMKNTNAELLKYKKDYDTYEKQNSIKNRLER